MRLREKRWFIALVAGPVLIAHTIRGLVFGFREGTEDISQAWREAQ